MKLSLYEQETIILYNQADTTAEVYTHDRKLMEKLTRLSQKHPEQVCKKTSTILPFPNAACRSGSRTAPSAARPPVNGLRLPDTGRPPPRKAMNEHGRERL